MAPLLLAAAGVAALIVAVLVLRSFGPGYRIGRLLGVVPLVTVAEAIRLAEAGDAPYVRIEGRIDSDAEFEDVHHQPLVLRRTTITWRPAGSRGAWKPADSRLEVVDFVVREGLDEVTIDGSSIDTGLVVVPRESVGEARDVEVLTAAGIDPGAQARLRVEQVSSIDHATVIGVPVRGADGRVTLGPGLGRPLILSTLEHEEALRVLAGGAAGRARLAVACLGAGAVLIGLAAAWWLVDAVTGGVATALAASPEPTLRPGSDTRSSGGGPGLVGEPLFALFGVLGIAALSLVASLAYVRLTGAGRNADRPNGRGPGAPR